MDTKYIFVTGGNVSSLGKGIASATMGRLLKSRGKTVTIIKMDPYINVDAGTMNPYQHGEVFVTDDGAETDLDLGHYERFVDINLNRHSNITTGKVYGSVIGKERKGEFLGGTVQVIPHITNEIKRRMTMVAKESNVDVVLIEIGGTVGDIEGQPFLEAIRQFRKDVGKQNLIYVHLTLVPYLGTGGELKTKLTQHSVKELRAIGIQPDIIICRSKYPINEEMKDKISLFCDIEKEAVIQALDSECIYEIPLIFEKEGLGRMVCEKLGIEAGEPDLSEWTDIVDRLKNPSKSVAIGIVGKYINLKDSYISIRESLVHAGIANDCQIDIKLIDAGDLEDSKDKDAVMAGVHGVLVPGGFGYRGIEGKIDAIRFAREQGVPFLGLCLGLQAAVIEFARNVCGMKDANSVEFNAETTNPVISLMMEQKEVADLGGTMRLGLYPCKLLEGSRAREVYGEELVYERHRHRYEVNNHYRDLLAAQGMVLSGTSPDRRLVEIVELPEHPFFMASQFHPEFKSRPNRPHPLFMGLVAAALKHAGK